MRKQSRRRKQISPVQAHNLVLLRSQRGGTTSALRVTSELAARLRRGSTRLRRGGAAAAQLCNRGSAAARPRRGGATVRAALQSRRSGDHSAGLRWLQDKRRGITQPSSSAAMLLSADGVHYVAANAQLHSYAQLCSTSSLFASKDSTRPDVLCSTSSPPQI